MKYITLRVKSIKDEHNIKCSHDTTNDANTDTTDIRRQPIPEMVRHWKSEDQFTKKHTKNLIQENPQFVVYKETNTNIIRTIFTNNRGLIAWVRIIHVN